jgi:hypothetical protein
MQHEMNIPHILQLSSIARVPLLLLWTLEVVGLFNNGELRSHSHPSVSNEET